MSQHRNGLTPVEDNTLRAQIARQLRDMITAGQYAPGERITETALANALHVSRAPLREAIRELVDAGILLSQPYRGLFVRSVSVADVRELFSMRIALEQFAFRLAWDKRTETTLADLRQRYDELLAAQSGGDQVRTIDCELRFHSWVYELSGHSLLQSHWQRLISLVQIYMSLHFRQHGSHGQYRDTTTEYLELATSGTLEQMLLHVEEHMQMGLESVVAALPE